MSGRNSPSYCTLTLIAMQEHQEQHFGEIKNEVFFLRTRIATFKGACGVDVSGNNYLPKQVLQSDYSYL